MLTFIKGSSDTSFQPDEVQVLVAAFDTAWGAIQDSGAKFETEQLALVARTIIAKHIIEAATHGERDPGRLRDGALLAYTKASFGAAPPPHRWPSNKRTA